MEDIMLNSLICYAEKGLNIDVTLLVNGTFISGNIISYNEYLKLLLKISDSSEDEYLKVLKSVVTVWENHTNKSKEDNGKLNLQHDFIHLKNVSMMSSMNYHMGDIPLRINLSHVSGFHFGTMI